MSKEQDILPHYLGKKQLTCIIQRLQEAKRSSTMQLMSVSNICQPGNKPPTFEDGRQVLENNVSDFIRERLRLYNQTWITDVLESVIEEAVASIYGSGKYRDQEIERKRLVYE